MEQRAGKGVRSVFDPGTEGLELRSMRSDRLSFSEKSASEDLVRGFMVLFYRFKIKFNLLYAGQYYPNAVTMLLEPSKAMGAGQNDDRDGFGCGDDLS